MGERNPAFGHPRATLHSPPCSASSSTLSASTCSTPGMQMQRNFAGERTFPPLQDGDREDGSTRPPCQGKRGRGGQCPETNGHCIIDAEKERTDDERNWIVIPRRRQGVKAFLTHYQSNKTTHTRTHKTSSSYPRHRNTPARDQDFMKRSGL